MYETMINQLTGFCQLGHGPINHGLATAF